MKVMITWLKCKSKKSKQLDLKVKIDLLFYKTDSIPQLNDIQHLRLYTVPYLDNNILTYCAALFMFMWQLQFFI